MRDTSVIGIASVIGVVALVGGVGVGLALGPNPEPEATPHVTNPLELDIPDDAQVIEVEPSASAGHAFDFAHEAQQPDPYKDTSGFNAWTFTWPDGSQEWCFSYSVTGSYKGPQMHCKPVPTDYTNTPVNPLRPHE